MNRQKLLKKAGWLSLALAVLIGLYTWQIEPVWVDFTRQDMPIRALPPSLEGSTLVQISDFHIGDRVDNNYVISTLKKVDAMKPDFVVYTGDFISLVDGKAPYAALQQIVDHMALGKYGTAAILGNHDYGKNWRQPEIADTICSMLEKKGIRMLRNARVSFHGLQFIGIDDLWASNFFPEKVLTQANLQMPTIVLCHNPDASDLPIWNGYNGWILAGHTHGGQCKPPFLPAPILPIKNKNYAQGLVQLEGGRTLYVNRGLGHSIKVRFNVRPEVSMFTLRKAKG
ncbi:metallophosphoesterase [Sphingobacterium bambusae]|uniref:Metallophosphoesterase n=1 Tax=Sphingobacterium bambusae TaxID=662858 RepID=A0ABW6BP58_9SPHI|nr:metallophosphoesterase [Sphingobacterium bambusae]WPL48159.1 metallophosphoesterase [Sphingobacterium bambusae]